MNILLNPSFNCFYNSAFACSLPCSYWVGDKGTGNLGQVTVFNKTAVQSWGLSCVEVHVFCHILSKDVFSLLCIFSDTFLRVFAEGCILVLFVYNHGSKGIFHKIISHPSCAASNFMHIYSHRCTIVYSDIYILYRCF